MIAAEFLAARLALVSGASPLRILEKTRNTLMKNRQYRLLPTIEMAQAWMRALLGRLEGVPKWILDREDVGTRVFSLITPIFHIIANQVLLSQENWSLVAARRDEIAAMCASSHFMLCTIYLHIQTSAALEQLGRRQAAMTELKTAMELALPDSILLPFAENGDLLSGQLHLLREQGIFDKLGITGDSKNKRLELEKHFSPEKP